MSDNTKGSPKLILECQEVSKSYKDSDRELIILQELNFKVHRGEQIAIVGKSGSGKSTMLNLLGGLDYVNSGKILFNGQEYFKSPPAEQDRVRNKHLGFIYQFHHLLPEFTAMENIAMPLLISGISPSDAQQQALVMLKAVGIEDRAFHLPAKLSGGERQRVAIARALVNNPDLVLADEPTGNLDRENAKYTFELIKNLNQSRGTTFIIVTHDLDLAQQLDKSYTLVDCKLRLGA